MRVHANFGKVEVTSSFWHSQLRAFRLALIAADLLNHLLYVVCLSSRVDDLQGLTIIGDLLCGLTDLHQQPG